jgi:hypothetical protein
VIGRTSQTQRSGARPGTRPRRVLPALVAGLTALGVLTSCSSTGTGAAGPEPGPGVAAVVGDRVVTTDLLTDRIRTAAPALAQALAHQSGAPGSSPLDPATLAAESRELLGTAVLHEVIAEASRREGIVVAPAQVDEQVAAAGGPQATAATGYDPATLREVVTDQIAVTEIGRRAFDGLATTVDIGTFGSRAAADQAAARLATDPGTGVLDALPPDARVIDATLRPGGLTSDSPVRSPSSLVFGLPGRTVSVSGSPPPSPGQSAPDPATQPWTVVRVRDRETTAPPAGGGAVPAELVDATTMFGFGLRAIQPLAVELGVRVNPRYGVWDPTQVRVAPTVADAGTVEPLQVALPVAPPGPAPVVPRPTAAAPTPAPSPAP